LYTSLGPSVQKFVLLAQKQNHFSGSGEELQNFKVAPVYEYWVCFLPPKNFKAVLYIQQETTCNVIYCKLSKLCEKREKPTIFYWYGFYPKKELMTFHAIALI
jgi:hypothetical protein